MAGSDRCAVSLLFFMKKWEKKEIMSCPPHVFSLFRATEVLAPLHWFTHTLPLFVPVSLCLFKLIAECRWALFHKELAECVRHIYVHMRVYVCMCANEFLRPRGWEGCDRGLDMLKRQSKWVFLKQWKKYHRFIPGQFMSPYLFLKHVTLATAEW